MGCDVRARPSIAVTASVLPFRAPRIIIRYLATEQADDGGASVTAVPERGGRQLGVR